MESVKEFLLPKSFNPFSFFLVLSSLVAGIILLGVVADNETNEQRYSFNCRIEGQHKVFFERTCFADYQAKTTRGLPLYGFVLLYFSCVTLVAILYSLFVKVRIEEIESQDQQAIPTNQSCRLYRSYCIQLVIRLTLGMIFLILQWVVFYPLHFPSKHTCDLTHIQQATPQVNATSGNTSGYWYDCYNPQASTKTFWTILVFSAIGLLTFFILVELMFVVIKAKVNDHFKNDLEFYQIHLQNKNRVVRICVAEIPTMDNSSNVSIFESYVVGLKENIKKKTKWYEALLPNILGEEGQSRELDTIYTNLIMYPGRAEYHFSRERHEIVEGYLKAQKQHKSINIEEIFAPNPENPQERPLSIMIIGRPGIGKSLLCLKILRDWACGKTFKEGTETRKRFEFVCLFKFRHFKSDETLNLRDLLGRRQFSGTFPLEVYEWILSHQEQVLFIFDGLDEFGKKENILKEEEFGNSLEEKIPFSALYAKLTSGKLLQGATVITTSRPTAFSDVSFPYQTFDRSLEILGFSYEEIKEYVARYCADSEATKERIIWNHISSNGNLLSLCYIPVTCHILCFTFEERLKQGEGNVECLPTTLTAIYEDALTIIVCKHNPEYRCNVPEQQKLLSSLKFSHEVEESLKILGEVAYTGIEDDRLIFESSEVKGHEESGLLHRLPNIKVGTIQRKEQYCFLHLTMQEFLAAKYTVAQIKKENWEFQSWISDHLHQGKWEVVMQFVAGLLSDDDYSKVTIFIDRLPRILTGSFMWPNMGGLLRLFKYIFEISRNSNSERSQLIRDQLSGIVNVDLSYASLTDADVTSIAFVLQEAKDITSLDVSNNYITSIGCFEIYKLLKMLGSSQSHCHGADNRVNQLSGAFAINECKLTRLVILNNEIDDNGIKHLSYLLAAGECHLTTLDISENRVGDDGLQHLSRALTKEECKLTALGISRNKIRDEVINGFKLLSKALSTYECKLTMLDISGNKIGDDVLRVLSLALSTNACKLTELNLGGNNITDDGVKHLSDALSTNECKIVKLVINGNEIGDKGLKILSLALSTNACKITELDISGNKIGDDGVKHLSDALATNECKITELDISGNKIGEDGFKYLADGLVTNQCKLTVLITKGNIMGDNGLKHLSEALSKCKLKTLKFSSYNIGYDGLKHLSDAIAKHGSKLTTLEITYTKFGDNLTATEIMELYDEGDGRLRPLANLLASSESARN